MLRERSAISAVLVLACAVCLGAAAQEETTSLDQMIADAEPGAIVTVPKGEHQVEKLKINKPLTLRGEKNDRWACQIMGQVAISAPDVTLENLSFLGTLSPALVDGRGYNPTQRLISAANADRLVVRNCVVRYSQGTGIILGQSKDVVLEDNLLTENGGTGLHIAACKNAVIRNNSLYRNMWFGIETSGIQDCRFEGNVIRGSGWTSIWLHSDATGNTIAENTIEGSDAGLTIGSSDNIVVRNLLRDNTIAIFLGSGPFSRSRAETGGRSDDDRSTSGNRILENTIVDGNHCGIVVRQGVGHVLAKNTILDMPQTGIAIQGKSDNVRVTGNRIERCGLWGVLVGQAENVQVARNEIADCRAAVRVVESKQTSVQELDTLGTLYAVLSDTASHDSLTASDGMTVSKEKKDTDLTTGEPHEWSASGQTYKLLVGDFHVHTQMSDGAGTEDEAYTYGRDALGLDFMSLSDHSDPALRYHGYDWWDDHFKRANGFNKPGRFSAFHGQEVTYPAKLYGHMNVYYAEDKGRPWTVMQYKETEEIRTLREEGTIEALLKIQKLMGGKPDPEVAPLENLAKSLTEQTDDVFAISHHYFRTEDYWKDFPQMDTRHFATEICSRHGIWETAAGPSRVDVAPTQLATLERALKFGRRLGVIGGSDTHYGTACDSALACVYAENNTRGAIREALKAHRTYGTTGARIIMEFSADGHPMGAQYKAEGTPHFEARVSNARDYDGKLYLLRGKPAEKGDYLSLVPGDEEIAEVSGAGVLELSYEDPDFTPGAYYRLRYVREDGELAWTTPIWID